MTARIVVAPLFYRPRALILAHLQLLSPDDRYDRFSIAMSDGALENYVASIDFERDIYFGIVVDGFNLAGTIHLSIHGDVAELGATVSRPYRGRGFALSLFRSAFQEAHARGIQEIHLATGHPAACAIARNLGYKIRPGGSYPKAIISLI